MTEPNLAAIDCVPMPSGMEVNKTNKYEAPCPTCDRHAKVTKISLSTHHLKVIILAIKECGGIIEPKWVGDNFDNGTYNNYQKLRHWGLIEKRSDGNWKVTQLAIDFLNSRVYLTEDLPIFANQARYIDDQDLYGRWVPITELPKYNEMSKEIAARNCKSVKIEN